MRVAVISHTSVEPTNRGKLEALAARGVHVTAFVPRRWQEGALGRTWDVEPESSPNLDVVPVDVRRIIRSPAAAWWDLAQLRERLSRRELDLVHVEEEPWSLCAHGALRTAHRHHVPSAIFTWQNLANHPPWPLSVLRRRTLQLADGWVAGNRDAARLLKHLDGNRPLTILPQLGVAIPDVHLTSVERAEGLRIGFVGRLVPEKGVDDLLAAVAKVEAHYTLDIVGEGPDRGALEERARELGLNERVRFSGAVTHGDVTAIWDALDVLVLPSRSSPRWVEQFGHVLIEAMAHGVAVIGSSSGAIPEVIGEAGIVVREGDSNAIGTALQELGINRARLEDLQARGRARAAEHYSNGAIAERLATFWKKLAHSPTLSGA